MNFSIYNLLGLKIINKIIDHLLKWSFTYLENQISKNKHKSLKKLGFSTSNILIYKSKIDL